jgi:hypothetical protein
MLSPSHATADALLDLDTYTLKNSKTASNLCGTKRAPNNMNELVGMMDSTKSLLHCVHTNSAKNGVQRMENFKHAFVCCTSQNIIV